MVVTHIAIIGAGQIGSRHLQALTKTKNEIQIYVVDPSQASLDVSKERFEQLPKSRNVLKIFYSKNLDSLKGVPLDIALIATASDIRRKVIEDLIAFSIPKFMILEKIVFQNNQDFELVANLLKKHQIKTWVNNPRRMWELYKFLKSRMQLNEKLMINISGSNWGLGSNCIHFIDLFHFLNGQNELIFSTNLLDEILHESKRKNFIELTGTLLCQNNNKMMLTMTSYFTGSSPLILSFSNPRISVIINESKGKIFISSEENNWNWEEKLFTIPYQSELTNIVVDDIITTGSCELTSFDESQEEHKFLLMELTKFISKIYGKEVTNCPIT